MASITPKVIRYWVSATAKVSRGGTKPKSKIRTAATLATIAGPRPYRAAASATAARKAITMFASFIPSRSKPVATRAPTARIAPVLR